MIPFEAACAELHDVLQAENTLLARHDHRAVADLAERKTRAVERFTQTGGAGPHRTEAMGVIRALATENQRLLAQALETQRRVLAIICGAARDTLAGDRGYGASAAGHRIAAPPPPVAMRVRA